jgi:penicillin amidase
MVGWDEEAGWEDSLVPAAEMPYVENPETGFVATANNKVYADGAGRFLTIDWLDGYRAGRIVELLEERNDWGLPATTRLQLDQQSVPWREMRDIVLRVQGSNPATQEALDLLGGWDGRVAADSVGAAVFELFLAEMCTRVARAKAPQSYRWALGQGFHPLVQGNAFAARRVGHLVRLLREQPAGWFEGRWDDEIAAALATVIQRLQADHGQDRDAWTWGRIRPLTLIHPFGQRKPFDRVFNLGPIPWGGDANTPSQAAARPLDPTGNPTFIASLRMVADVGAWDNSTFVLPGGQSGNPFSSHYGDQLPLWQRGESIPIPWSDAAVEAAVQDTLQLLPVNSPFE